MIWLKPGAYDYGTIHRIIDSVPILHVSFTPENDPFPATLPMLGCTGVFGSPATENEPRYIYVHGHASSRLMKLAKEEEGEGIPVCVAASSMDGIVLALSPFHNSCNYRSAIVHGYAHQVTDEAEKIRLWLVTAKSSLSSIFSREKSIKLCVSLHARIINNLNAGRRRNTSVF